ncbi:unnamed protein product [Urochloa humidicola]
MTTDQARARRRGDDGRQGPCPRCNTILTFEACSTSSLPGLNPDAAQIPCSGPGGEPGTRRRWCLARWRRGRRRTGWSGALSEMAVAAGSCRNGEGPADEAGYARDCCFLRQRFRPRSRSASLAASCSFAAGAADRWTACI